MHFIWSRDFYKTDTLIYDKWGLVVKLQKHMKYLTVLGKNVAEVSCKNKKFAILKIRPFSCYWISSLENSSSLNSIKNMYLDSNCAVILHLSTFQIY